MSDAERMRKPIKDQTFSFGRADVESHRTTATARTSYKPQSDSEKMREPIKDQTLLFGRADVESHKNETSSKVSRGSSLTDSEKMSVSIKPNAPRFAQANIN